MIDNDLFDLNLYINDWLSIQKLQFSLVRSKLNVYLNGFVICVTFATQ